MNIIETTNDKLLQELQKSKQEMETWKDERLYSTLNHLMEGCQIIGFDWEFIFLNDVAVIQSRFKKDELLGKRLIDLYPGIEATELFAIMKRCLEQRIAHHFENEFVYPDGTKGWFDLSIQPVPEGIFILSNDITEHKVKDISLKESEERYRLIAENSADIISVFDLNLNRIYVSPSIQNVLGFTVQEAMSQTSHQTLPTASQEKVKAIFEEQMKLESSGIADPSRTTLIEIEEYRKDGSTIWVEISARFLRDVNLKATGILTVTRNISERKEAELALKQVHDELKHLHDNLDLAIFSRDMITQKMLLVSKGYINVFGLTEDELNNNPQMWYQSILPEDRTFVDSGYPNLFLGKAIHHTYRISHKIANEIRWIEATIKPTLDSEGRLIRIDGIASDITERKMTEIALIDAQKRLDGIVNTTFDAIISIDDEQNIILFNNGAERIFGYNLTEIIGKPLATLLPQEFPKTHNEKVETYGKSTTEHSRRMSLTREINGRRKDGSIFPTEVHISKSTINGKNTYTAILQDISERKQAEQLLLKINSALNNQVAESFRLAQELEVKNLEKEAQNEELRIAIERAEQSDKLKTAFLANMSHEIRTPMIGIIGFSKILTEGNLSKSEKIEYAAEMNKSSNRLLNLLNNIILASQIESGNIEVEKNEFNLNDLISELYSNFLESARKNNTDFNTSIDLNEDQSIITNDEEKLSKILSIILDNSIKFTHAGYICFGYKTYPDEFEFFVKDTGIGISKEFIPQIFEMFSQESTQFNRTYEGAGIGLAIAKGFVQLLGGKIWVESEKGNGTTFYFTLPRNKCNVNIINS